MFNRLWSSATQDPPLAIAVVIAAVFVVAFVIAWADAIRENRRSHLTTAAQLRKDAHTEVRQQRLRTMQGRAIRRCDSSIDRIHAQSASGER